MSIKKIFKDGMAEHKRKSSLRSSKRNLVEKEKAYEVKLTALGKKARDAKLDISQFGDLSGTLSQIEGKGKEIGAKLDELNKQTSRLEEKKKAENVRFDALWKDLETKKKPVDSELKSEKDKLEKAQKEAESIQKRLKNIPDEEEKIRRKITESQGNAQAQAELEKKLTALKEEQKQLDPKLPDLTKIIQAAGEKITPLDQQSGRLEAEMKKAKDRHKKEIEDIDKTLSKVKGEINEFNKQQKAVSGQQVQNFQALGKKLSEANVADPAVAAELEAVKAAEKEMAYIRTNIQSLEDQKAPGARGAVLKMVGVVFLFFVLIAAIVFAALLLIGTIKLKKAQDLAHADPCSYPSETAMSQDNKSTVGINKPFPQEELNQRADKLEKYFQALEAAVQEIPRDTFDPQVIVDKVGKDAEMLFKWVRDNTYFVPYQGVLRGPVGVLMDRLGNSLDRALLLYELLHLAGFQVRLARGTLSEETAKDLPKRTRPIPEAGVFKKLPLSSQEIESLVEKSAQKYQIDNQEIRNAIYKVSRDQEAMAKELEKRVADQTKYIYSAVADYRKKQGEGGENAKYQEIQDHWWVQVEKDNIWLDMDPTLAEAKVGTSLTEAKKFDDPTNLTENLFQLVKVQIIVERCSAGNIKENIVLQHTFKPSELFGKRIALRHVAMNRPQNFSLLGGNDSINKLRAAILSEKEWLPYLIVGSEQIYQSSFSDGGEINRNPEKKSSSGGPGGLTKGLFNALAGQEKEESPTKNAELTAEWIEYEFLSPGHPDVKTRRQIFDLIGPAARSKKDGITISTTESQRIERGMALLGETEILIQACQFSPDYVRYIMAKNLLINRQVLPDLIRQCHTLNIEDLEKISRKIVPQMGLEYSLVLLRKIWSHSSSTIYLDRPNILNYFTKLVWDPKDYILGCSGIDIVSNEVAVFPNIKADPFLEHLRQGVLDTNAEALLMSKLGNVAENTSEIFSRSKDLDIEWIILTNPEDPGWRKVKLSPDIRSRIEKEFENGCIVLAPNKMIKKNGRELVGWWKIDPLSGNILGIGAEGYGQGPTEYTIIQIMKLGIFVECGALAICAARMADGMRLAAEQYQQHKDQERYRQEAEAVQEKFTSCAAIAAIGAAAFGILPFAAMGQAEIVLSIFAVWGISLL